MQNKAIIYASLGGTFSGAHLAINLVRRKHKKRNIRWNGAAAFAARVATRAPQNEPRAREFPKIRPSRCNHATVCLLANLAVRSGSAVVLINRKLVNA